MFTCNVIAILLLDKHKYTFLRMPKAASSHCVNYVGGVSRADSTSYYTDERGLLGTAFFV